MTRTGSYKKNTFWLMLFQVYCIAVTFLVGPLVAKALAPEAYGDLNYAESLVTIFFSASILGMNNLMVAELVMKPDKEEEIVGTALVLRLISAAVCMFAAAVTILILRPDNHIIQISVFLQTTLILFQVYDVFNYWFQARLMSKYFTIISGAGLTIASIYKVWLVFHHPDIYLFSLSNSVRYGFILIVLVIVFFRLNPGFHLCFNRELAKDFFSRGMHFAVAGVGSVLYQKIDNLMVGSMISSAWLSFYAIAVNICNIWQLIPNTLVTSAAPLIMKFKGNDEKAYIETYQLLLLGMTVFAVLVCLAAMLVGGPVISFLYGDAYKEAIPLFLILMWSSVFSLLNSARSVWVTGEHLEAYSKYFVYCGLVIDVILNYFMIHGFGAAGAAFATFLTEFAVFFLIPLVFPKTRMSNRLYFGCFRQFPQLIRIVRRGKDNILERIRGKRENQV